MSVARVLLQLEEGLLQHSTRKDRPRVESLLTEEFLEFGSSGRVFTKAEILDSLQTESELQLSLNDFTCVELAQGVALVTYRANRMQLGVAAVESLRSSIWVLRSDRWQMLFHQGTKALPD